VGQASRSSVGHAGRGSPSLIAADTSILVRYLVGTPVAQARRAAKLIDDDDLEIGISPVVLAECAHVLRTGYEVPARDVVDSLIDLVQRENIRMLGVSTELVVQHLVLARSMPGRPIPDALIVAAAVAGGAEYLATFDLDQRRYGIPIRQP
jgi:predicted nucleic acid-binding protein